MNGIARWTMGSALTLALGIGQAQPAGGGAEAEMRAEVDAGKLQSVAFALVDNGRIVHEGAFGWADKEHRVAATAHTPYPLASVTKPVTATAVMMLIERGRVRLEDPIAQVLPGLDASFSGNVRQLLGHTSGLTTYARIQWPDQSWEPKTNVAIQQRHAFAAQPPGSMFEYSNLGYGLLGRLVEARSGQKLGDFLGRELLLPLGMRDAVMPEGSEVPAGGAGKFDSAGKPLPPTWNDTPGAGNLYASAHDMALFSAFHMPGANQDAGTSSVLSIAGRQLMQRHAEPGARYDYYDGARYGLGWYVRDTPGREPIVWHEGGMPGASAIVLMLPRRGVAAVVLINQTDANESAQRFSQALIRSVVPDFAGASLDPTQGMARYAGGDDLRGEWAGQVSVDGRQVPWILKFNADGTATSVFADTPNASASPTASALRPTVKDGLVLGAFSADLPAEGVSTGPGRYLLLRLMRRGNSLSGALVAYSSEERLEYLLPFPAHLERAAR